MRWEEGRSSGLGLKEEAPSPSSKSTSVWRSVSVTSSVDISCVRSEARYASWYRAMLTQTHTRTCKFMLVFAILPPDVACGLRGLVRVVYWALFGIHNCHSVEAVGNKRFRGLGQENVCTRTPQGWQEEMKGGRVLRDAFRDARDLM